MTDNDIDAIRQRPLTDEPGNNTFIVWYDSNREPYAVYFRSDANAWGDQRWFNGDQHHSGGTEPSDWHELCDELFGNDGPHLLVPGAKVDELTAALAERDNQLTQSRAQAATYANEIGLLTAENARLRQQRDELREQVFAQKPVVKAAEAWAEAWEELKGDDTVPYVIAQPSAALHDAIEQHRLMDMALTSARAEHAEATR